MEPVTQSPKVRKSWRLYGTLFIILPVLGVVVARAVLSGPRSAQGAGPSKPVQIVPLPELPGRAAPGGNAAGTQPAEFQKSPFATEQAPVEPSPVQPEPAPRVERPFVPQLPATCTLTSIMTGRSGVVAVVGGKVRKVGDEPSPGWTILAIDPVASEVTLVHQNGTKTSLTLREDKK